MQNCFEFFRRCEKMFLKFLCEMQFSFLKELIYKMIKKNLISLPGLQKLYDIFGKCKTDMIF